MHQAMCAHMMGFPNARVFCVTAITIALCITGTCAVFAQQVTKTNTAEVSADNLVVDWDSGRLEFSGHCKVIINAGHQAEMTATKMVVQLNDQANRIDSLIAYGPVNFNVITEPNSQGLRRKIVASAQSQATYSEATQVVALSGGAQADMSTLGISGATAHFTGQTITANLKTSKLSVDDANLMVKTPVKN